MESTRTRPIWAFLTGPYAVFLVFLLLVPFANVAMYSIHPSSPTQVFLPELTLENYRKIFDLYYFRLFGRTLRLGLITTAVCVVLGYPLAYFLARALPRVQALCLFFLIMPLMVSAVIRVFGWIVILGRKGLVNQALVALGLEPIKLLYSETAFVTPALMGNARERMAGQQIYDEVLVSFNWPSASSLALTLVLLTVGLMFCAL